MASTSTADSDNGRPVRGRKFYYTDEQLADILENSDFYATDDENDFEVTNANYDSDSSSDVSRNEETSVVETNLNPNDELNSSSSSEEEDSIPLSRLFPNVIRPVQEGNDSDVSSSFFNNSTLGTKKRKQKKTPATNHGYIPTSYRKGKKKPLQIVLQNEEFQDAFIRNMKKAFACLNDLLYGQNYTNDVNEVRLTLFLKSYSMKSDKQSFNKTLRNFDTSTIPACKAELYQQLFRVSYVADI
ncbi:unnamed protein product [Psylliodes chrysocephalus]|uniref:Uncharacterized protein n=1 Tax=Psylliodes chrysocephalus TaxID=3402493 RepID=A0A9P0CY27_9CUCU|nr:unnamed protein product [Psylliodes chrysocephala]